MCLHIEAQNPVIPKSVNTRNYCVGSIERENLLENYLYSIHDAVNIELAQDRA